MSLLSLHCPVLLKGGDTHPGSAYQHSKIRFKNADAIGFPAGDALAEFFGLFGYICAPSSQTFRPYFLSTLDSLTWHSGAPEMAWPESLTPGLFTLPLLAKLIALWLGALTWAGLHIGNAMGNAFSDVKNAGGQAGKMMVSQPSIPAFLFHENKKK